MTTFRKKTLRRIEGSLDGQVKTVSEIARELDKPEGAIWKYLKCHRSLFTGHRADDGEYYWRLR